MNKNRLKILIPNATSARNIGDAAMLDSLISLVKNSFKNPKIVIHSNEPELYPSTIAHRIEKTLYYWAAFSTENKPLRVFRIAWVFIAYFLIIFNIHITLSKELSKLIEDYKDADLIIFVGGGYFRSKTGLTQSVHLLLLLSMFWYAGLCRSKKIIAPISFGPFAHKWQELLTARAIKNFEVVSVREKISFDKLKKNRIRNLILAADHGLLQKKSSTKKKNLKSQIKLGFTVRNWLANPYGRSFELHFIEAIKHLSSKYNLIVQPIIQVHAPLHPQEDDSLATTRVIKELNKSSIQVNRVKKIKNVDHAKKIYADVDLLLGMRMHSNILAATQGTPFLAISYEHKSEGISKYLGMEKYCIKCEKVNKENLYELLVDVYKNRNDLKNKLLSSVKAIQINETQKWNKILSQY